MKGKRDEGKARKGEGRKRWGKEGVDERMEEAGEGREWGLRSVRGLDA